MSGWRSDLQAVLKAIARTAARLCEAKNTLIHLVDGDQLRRVAKHGSLPTALAVGESMAISRGHSQGRAVLDQRTIHVRDLRGAAGRSFPDARAFSRVTGVRIVLSAPLLSNGVPVGVITARRTTARPFTARQITLLKTFAEQAAIAIENARLSEALATRNRELTEALEQQTAASEILRVISSRRPIFNRRLVRMMGVTSRPRSNPAVAAPSRSGCRRTSKRSEWSEPPSRHQKSRRAPAPCS